MASPPIDCAMREPGPAAAMIITLLQGFGLLALGRILFGGFGGGGGGGFEKHMTEKDRERFRERMRDRVCEDPPAGDVVIDSSVDKACSVVLSFRGSDVTKCAISRKGGEAARTVVALTRPHDLPPRHRGVRHTNALGVDVFG